MDDWIREKVEICMERGSEMPMAGSARGSVCGGTCTVLLGAAEIYRLIRGSLLVESITLLS